MRKRYGFLLGVVLTFVMVVGWWYQSDSRLYAAENGGGGWVQTGPDGGTMFAIAADPNDPTRIYARSRAGIHRSVDGGDRWELVADAFQIGGRRAVVVDPTDSLHLMAVDDDTGNIHASSDGGTTWNDIDAPFGADGIAFDPLVNGRVWAFTEDEEGGVYRSVDGGATWEAVTLPGFSYPTSLVAHPTEANTVYVEASGLFFRSGDGGDTWEEAGSTGFRRLVAMSEDAIYAIYDDIPPSSPAIVRSTDDGETWEPFETGIEGASITSLVIDPNDPTQLYAGGRNGSVYRTTTSGSTWELVEAELPNGGAFEAPQLAIAATQPATLYYASEGVYRSMDKGESWTRTSSGLSAMPIAALAVDPTDSLHLFTNGRQGELVTSTNGGTTWITIPLTPTLYLEIRSIVFAPSASEVLYFSTFGDGVFRSADGGVTWNQAATGLPLDGDSYFGIIDIAVDPTNSEHVLAAVDTGLIYRTTNGGMEWTLAYEAKFSSAIWDVTFAPSNPLIVWAGSRNGVVQSTDGGATWTMPTVSGLPEGADVRLVAIDPTTPNRLYAGVRGEASVVYRSVDGGATWVPLDTSVYPFARVEAIWIDPSAPQTVLFSANYYDVSELYLLEPYGILRSEDGGDTWNPDPNPLGYPAVKQIDGEASRLYAGTYAGGVWRLGDVPTTTFTYLPLIGSEAAAGR
jgi:photosystem II stability/assembly factor-like uncharacterized protein